MKHLLQYTNLRNHTYLLGIMIVVIFCSTAAMIFKQSQGDTVNQHRESTKVRFLTNTSGGKQPSISAEVADTPYKHEYGLMFRGQINRGNGMLFIFDDETIRNFWMKNTYIPLDMIFVNGSGKIVHIEHGAKPMNEATISSILPSKYVIEVNSGRTMQARIKTGDFISIESNL